MIEKKLKLKRKYLYLMIILLLILLLVFLFKIDNHSNKDNKTIVIDSKLVKGVDIEDSTDENNEEYLVSDNVNSVVIKPLVGTLNQVFSSDVYSYNLNLTYDNNALSFIVSGSDMAEVNGINLESVPCGNSSRIINVLFNNGEERQYEFNVYRDYSSSTTINNIIPSVGELVFDNGKNVYEMIVSDDVSKISFDVIRDSDITVNGAINRELEYGNNEIKIEIVAPNKINKRYIVINVFREKDLSTINVSNNIMLDVGENQIIIYDLDPIDTSFKDVYFLSDNENVASVDQNGLVTGVSYGETKVYVVSKSNENIRGIVNVKVIKKKVSSSKYNIVRNEIDYIIGIEPEIKVSDFLSGLDNDCLFVYKDGKVMSDEDIISTGMELKYFIDDMEFDSLIIIVRGDLTSNGYVLTSDYTKLKNMINGLVLYDDVLKLAGDVNKDGEITNDDSLMVYDYLMMKINSLN